MPKTAFDVGRKPRRDDEQGNGDDGSDSDHAEDEDDEDDSDEDGEDLADLGEEEGLDPQFLLGMDKNALGR